MLDDDLHLLGDVVRVQPHPAHQALQRPALLHLAVVVLRAVVRQLEGELVAGVIAEHVEDKALLDRLLHGVDVERRGWLIGRGATTEALDRLGLGRGGEGEVADRAVFGPRLHPGQQYILGRELLALGQLLGGQHLRQVARGRAGLRRVRLVGDHREGAPLQARLLADRVEHEREGLQGDDDDRRVGFQRLRQLLGLGRPLVLDRHDDARLVLELVDRLLQLAVEHGAVGDDDHRAEDLAVMLVVQRGKAMRQPGDRVRLARAGRVLDQVVVPRPLAARGSDQRAHRIPLVVAREDQRLALLLRAVRAVALLRLQVDEVAEDVEQAVAPPDALPEVGGRVAVRVRRVALPAVVPQVEGQEDGLRPGQAGRHRDLGGADREVDQRAALEGEQRLILLGVGVARRAVVLVLPDGVAERLGEVGLQLGGGDGDTVDKEGEVDAVLFVQAVAQLAHHAAAHLVVSRQRRGIESLARTELAEVEPGVDVLEAAPQHPQRPIPVQRLGEPLHHDLPGAAPGRCGDLRQFLRLRVRQPADHILGVERQRPVVPRRLAEQPAIGRQVRHDLVLKRPLLVLHRKHPHHGRGGSETRPRRTPPARTSATRLARDPTRALWQPCQRLPPHAGGSGTRWMYPPLPRHPPAHRHPRRVGVADTVATPRGRV